MCPKGADLRRLTILIKNCILPDIDCSHCGPVIVCKHTEPQLSTTTGCSLQELFLERTRGRKRQTKRIATEHVAHPGQNPRYVAAAISRDLEVLAAAVEGVRNDTLLKVACNIFEFVRGGHANEAGAYAELERIAGAIGLPDREIHSTLE
jgi:hypothetical protein